MYLTTGEESAIEDITGDWRRQSCRIDVLILPAVHLRHMYISGLPIPEMG